jgi:Domain of unknown function (DUF6794)
MNQTNQFIVLMAFLLFGWNYAFSQSDESRVPDLEEITTCQAAIEDVYANLTTDSLDTLRKTKEDDLTQFHFGWGTGIRNNYGFWNEASPIRKSCSQRLGKEDAHPDDAAFEVIVGVWELANANM